MSLIILPKVKKMQIGMVVHEDHVAFTDIVNEALRNGWNLHGTPIVDPKGRFVQQVTKTVEFDVTED